MRCAGCLCGINLELTCLPLSAAINHGIAKPCKQCNEWPRRDSYKFCSGDLCRNPSISKPISRDGRAARVTSGHSGSANTQLARDDGKSKRKGRSDSERVAESQTDRQSGDTSKEVTTQHEGETETAMITRSSHEIGGEGEATTTA